MYDKVKAAAIHLLVSIIIISNFLLLVYFIWYPYPFYITEGLSQITIILLGVDLALGPIMTLILYRKGKKYLLFDLSVVIAIQFSAFVYGVVTIAEGRPVYIVFATDVYKTVPPSMIDITTLKDKSLNYSFFSPPIYIYATAPPIGTKEHQNLMWSVLSGGKDIELLPQYYQNYNKNFSAVIKKKDSYGYSERFKKDNKLNNQLIEFITKKDLKQEHTGIFPLFGNEKTVIAIVTMNNGKIVGFIDTTP